MCIYFFFLVVLRTGPRPLHLINHTLLLSYSQAPLLVFNSLKQSTFSCSQEQEEINTRGESHRPYLPAGFPGLRFLQVLEQQDHLFGFSDVVLSPSSLNMLFIYLLIIITGGRYVCRGQRTTFWYLFFLLPLQGFWGLSLCC